MFFARKSTVRQTLAYRLVVMLIKPWVFLFTRRDWRGTEQVRVGGPLIVCSNHISNFDVFAVAHYLHDNGRPPRFLAKSELFRLPLLGWLLRACGQIPVYRGTSQAANALRDAEQALANGETVVIYPEGTFTHDPGLWPMTGLTGAARLALATGCPVVPLAQWGAQEVIPVEGRGLDLLGRHEMHLLAGAPIDFSDLLERGQEPAVLQEATSRIMRAIADLLAELRGEPAPVTLWDRRVKPEVQEQ